MVTIQSGEYSPARSAGTTRTGRDPFQKLIVEIRENAIVPGVDSMEGPLTKIMYRMNQMEFLHIFRPESIGLNPRTLKSAYIVLPRSGIDPRPGAFYLSAHL